MLAWRLTTLVAATLISLCPLSAASSNTLSSLTGWHSRVEPATGPFTPTRDSLAFAELRSTPADPNGFTVAFFSPNIVVDARGVVSTLDTSDWQGIKNLVVEAVTSLPQTGVFRNQWRIAHARTGQPIDWLRVVTSSTEDLGEVSAYGYDGVTTTLETPVGGYTTLPPVLDQVFGLLQEARSGYVKGAEVTVTIDAVKAVLPSM
ncbi:hypothetical protein FRB99_003946 [Tulasnella sp. 403]|nr:hypothetical protein FRB99_003946 [Tulasnella sp. 403]